MFKPEEPSEILIQEYVFFMLRKSIYFQVKAIDLSVNIISWILQIFIDFMRSFELRILAKCLD